MNFSGISSKSTLGRMLRFPLRYIPKNTELPIVQGKLRGYKWNVGSSSHGCWLGSYEYKKQRKISQLVEPGSVAFDIGAYVGFYTLLFSQLVGLEGRVFAFEPLPRNIQYLTRHIAINNVSNVVIVEGAVSNSSGATLFVEGPNSSMGRISDTGSIEIVRSSIDELMSDGKLLAPDYVKMDIEGAEYDALCGAEATLQEFHPTIFLATHGIKVHRECCRFLTGLGYKLQSISGGDISDTDEILARHASRH